ncbi:unnamed protein product, partial [Rotaria sp. Silwood1]
FNGADLSYANFIKATLGGRIDFEGTNLALADFTNMWLQTPIFVNILNTNMAGVRCCGEKHYDTITNNFPDGIFKCVRKILFFDERPFEHEFFFVFLNDLQY